MEILDSLVLPEDVILVPVADLSEDVRQKIGEEDGEWAITRPRGRTSTRMLDEDGVRLLQEFRQPNTIVQAVLTYCEATASEPSEILKAAYPMLRRLLDDHLLVPADSAIAAPIDARWGPGDSVAGFEVIRCVHVLQDTELYRVRASDGTEAALKIGRPGYAGKMGAALQHEAAILGHLDGQVSPRLLASGDWEESPYLAATWVAGSDAAVAAARLRNRGADRRRLLNLCCAIVDAYAHLHTHGVVHGDIHPRNVLVGADNQVTIIDFGLSGRKIGRRTEQPWRSGVGYYFEPEYARAALGRRRAPRSTPAGEQYALAAMLYYLISGTHYLDFVPDQKEMFRQIAEEPPHSFASRRGQPWPEVEALLQRALRKQPGERFASVAAFGKQMRGVLLAMESAGADVGAAATAPGATVNADRFLTDVLRRIGRGGELCRVSAPPTASVMYGAAGIACALYRIACVRGDADLLSQADVWAHRAAEQADQADAFVTPQMGLTREIIGEVTPYHTVTGIHLVQALINRAMGEIGGFEREVARFIAAAQAPCANPDLTLGRAGVLLGCSLLAEAAPSGSSIDGTSLYALGESTMGSLWEEGQEVRDYLGMAHGWAGILYASLRWNQATGAPLPAALYDRLNWLTTQGLVLGRRLRWPMVAGRPDHLPGWCNGSSGHIWLWTLAHKRFGEEHYLRLAEQSALDTCLGMAEAGHLCCGVAGQAYGLLNLFKHTGEGQWLEKARSLAARAPAYPAPPMWRDSLYKGDVGVAVLLADLDKPEQACMPLFDTEGWAVK